MKLYHGTTADILPDVHKNGLKPRSVTKRNNWKEHGSNPEYVYLSSCYAPFFAQVAAAFGKWPAVVLELEFDSEDRSAHSLTDKFAPDEDFLEQASRGTNVPPGYDMGAMTAYYRTKMVNNRYRKMWPMSIKYLGTVAHHGVIDPKWIKRAAVIEFDSKLHQTFSDPTITIANKLVCGERYEMFTRWLFGEVPTFEHYMRACLYPEPLKAAALKAYELHGELFSTPNITIQ
jgi:hypothetical protein